MTIRLNDWYFRFLEDRQRDTEIHAPGETIVVGEDEAKHLIAAKKAELA